MATIVCGRANLDEDEDVCGINGQESFPKAKGARGALGSHVTYSQLFSHT